MNNDELKRLIKLQEDSDKVAGSFMLTNLTLPDLLLLLREDEELRALIRDIVAQPATENDCVTVELEDSPSYEDEVENTAPLPLRKHLAQLPGDTLRQQLTPELLLLKTVQADVEIAAAWLGEQVESEGRQLLRLVTCSAQWDLLSDLWEKLAKRCKQAQRAANAHELHILKDSLALYNLRWQGRQALLVEVELGIAYDYERHQRGTPTGDMVRALWLPGLVNAGGQLHKKPLVAT